jgi:hypothetical protein
VLDDNPGGRAVEPHFIAVFARTATVDDEEVLILLQHQ